MQERNNKKYISGYTLIEVLIAIGILTIMSLLSLQAFQNINSSESVKKDTLQILLALRQARSFTLDSKNSDQYGVHFSENQVVLFQGSSYISNDASNTPIYISGRNKISLISLTGGGSDIVFDQVTGETSEDGTVTISSNDGSIQKTITVYKTGLAQMN